MVEWYEKKPHKSDRSPLDYRPLGLALIAAATATTSLSPNMDRQHNYPASRQVPLEKAGSHHGFAEMPSVAHLKQFTVEHGITINLK